MVGLDFGLVELTGFEMPEIDLRIASLDHPPEGTDDPADLVPQLQAGPAISKIGDLWLLGRHRLLCGSALDPAAFAALMGEERAAMVFTDPPYNVPIDGHASGLGAIRHRPFPMASGEMDPAEFTAFLAEAFGNLATFSVDGSVLFICMDWRHLEELLAASRNAYSGLLNLCIWTKSAPGMGAFYRSQHELVFVFKHGRRSHRNNVQLGRFGRNRSNVWNYPGANSFARRGDEGNLLSVASHGQAGRDGRRRDPRLHGARRHRPRCVSRQRHDGNRRRTHRPALLRVGARRALRRHDRPSLAGADRRRSPSCRERLQL